MRNESTACCAHSIVGDSATIYTTDRCIDVFERWFVRCLAVFFSSLQPLTSEVKCITASSVFRLTLNVAGWFVVVVRVSFD